MKKTVTCSLFVFLLCLNHLVAAQDCVITSSNWSSVCSWDDAFPDVSGWRKTVSVGPDIVETRTDGPGYLVSGSWSNVNGAKLDQDGQTSDTAPSAETDMCEGDCWDGGTQWLVARKFRFNIPSSATIQAIAFAFRWSVDGGSLYDCPIEIYNFGVMKNNSFVPYAYAWYYQDPYVPPPNSFSQDWWPLNDEIGWPVQSGIWQSNAWVPVWYTNGYPLWGNEWSASNINDPGFGAAVSVEFPWSCAGDPTNIHIDNVRMAVYFTGGGPVITGPDNVWWFNGENPSNYPASVTLTSDAGEGTIWGVVAGAEKVQLNATGSTATITSTGCCFSSEVDDIQITAQADFQTSAPFHVTTRSPYQLVPTDTAYACSMDWGYDRWIYYKIQDQLLTDLPMVIGVNEDWATEVIPDYPGTDWARGPIQNTTTDATTLQFYDHIQGESAGKTPDPYCQGTLGSKVEHWGQIFRVGSTVTGAGTEVQVDTLQKYENNAYHENIER